MAKNIDPSSVTDILGGTLECPICLLIPRKPPVYQCDNGHIICNKCHSNVSICPICRVRLRKTRSLVSEKVLPLIIGTCQFTNHGCNVKLLNTELDDHELVCLYREIHCVDLVCEEKVSATKLIEHMHKNHAADFDFGDAKEGLIFVNTKSQLAVNEADYENEGFWYGEHLILDGNNFFCETMTEGKGVWYMWVYVLGTPEDCKNYDFTVKIICLDDTEELTYTGQCLPLDTAKEEITETGQCLIFIDKTAKRFCVDSRLNYFVEVRRNQR